MAVYNFATMGGATVGTQPNDSTSSDQPKIDYKIVPFTGLATPINLRSVLASFDGGPAKPCGACLEGDCQVKGGHVVYVQELVACSCCGLVPGVHY